MHNPCELRALRELSGGGLLPLQIGTLVLPPNQLISEVTSELLKLDGGPGSRSPEFSTT